MRGVAIALALLLSSAAIAADVVSPAPESVRVTLYGNQPTPVPDYRAGDYGPENPASTAGLVMVSETRTIDLPRGLSTIVFRGVADAIVPQTASIEGMPATLLESNFDYDLLTPGALIAKSHGERVRLVRTDAATGRTSEREAILRSGPWGVVLEVDGAIEALGCSGLSEKLVFSRLPAGLADEPRLSMTVRATRAGRHTVELNYLALGMHWSADYIARIDENDSTLDLTGWITLINRSGTTFANTPAEVVAGQLARDEQETQPPGPTQVHENDACWPIGQFATVLEQFVARQRGVDHALASGIAPPALYDMAPVVQLTSARPTSFQAVMRELGDYKLYAVPERTTIAARQSKQVQFLSQADVPFQRLYRFKLDEPSLRTQLDRGPRRASVLLRMQNEKSEGLGKPLPRGTVSVMEAHGSASVLAGQDRIKDTPVGLPVELTLGQAMDVWVEPRITSDETIRLGRRGGQVGVRVGIEVKVLNDKPVPITLEYRHPPLGADFRILEESQPHTLKDGELQWSFDLRPGESAVLRYSMERS